MREVGKQNYCFHLGQTELNIRNIRRGNKGEEVFKGEGEKNIRRRKKEEQCLDKVGKAWKETGLRSY